MRFDMMKPLHFAAMLICACAAVSCSTPTGASPSSLELKAFVNGEQPERLVINIINRGRQQVTVLTKGYSLASVTMNGRKSPYFHLVFEIWKFEWPDAQGKKQRQTIVPSLPELSPVTLRQDETAQMTVALDEAYQQSLARPDAKVSVIYEIREDIAERFALWQGKIELKTTVGELRQHTANKVSEATSPKGAAPQN